MGVEVRGRDRTLTNTREVSRRHLRLVAQRDSGGTDAEPSFGYVLHERASAAPSRAPLLPGPTIMLKRGEPVSITVVNELPEATAVHWHGIELESYFDGVAGYSGHGRRIAPAIAPRRLVRGALHAAAVGHVHVSPARRRGAPAAGRPARVRCSWSTIPATFDPARDIVLLLTVPRRDADGRARGAGQRQPHARSAASSRRASATGCASSTCTRSGRA